MNRRDFIKSLGIGVIAAPIVAKAASEPKPDDFTKRLHDMTEAYDALSRHVLTDKERERLMEYMEQSITTVDEFDNDEEWG